METRSRWSRFWCRLSFRVTVGIVVCLVPTFFDVPQPAIFRDGGTAIVAAAFASWVQTQGKRRPRPPTFDASIAPGWPAETGPTARKGP